jgi:hypothetical protein
MPLVEVVRADLMPRKTQSRLFPATVTQLMLERVGSVPSPTWMLFPEGIHGLQAVHRPTVWQKVVPGVKVSSVRDPE